MGIGIFVTKADDFSNVSQKAGMGQIRDNMESRRDDAIQLFELIRSTTQGNENNDYITTEQIQTSMMRKDLHVLEHFQRLDIDMHNPVPTIKRFDKDHDGSLQQHEFVDCCQRLQGAAKPAELFDVLDKANDMNNKLENIIKRLDELKR